jgi:hypothetical protein
MTQINHHLREMTMTETPDQDLAQLAANIKGKNNGEIRAMREGILSNIADVQKEVAGRAAGCVAQSPPESIGGFQSGAVHTIRELEQRAVILQKMAHYLDGRLPEAVRLNLSPFYTPGEPLPKAPADPDLLQVHLDTIDKSQAELFTLRSKRAARIAAIENDAAARDHDWQDRLPPASDRNLIERRTVGQIEREIAFIDALLDSSPSAA